MMRNYKAGVLIFGFMVAVMAAAVAAGQASGPGGPTIFLPLALGAGDGGPIPTLVPPPSGPDIAWGTVPSPNSGPADHELLSISAAADDDIWAVGAAGDGPLASHWDGGDWSLASLPALPDRGVLNGVAAVAGDDVWAVGRTGSPASLNHDTVIMHWDGDDWNLIPSPNGNPDSYNELWTVAAVSSTDVWAVGEYLAGDVTTRPLIVHWDGLSWSIVAQNCTTYGGLMAIAVVAADDIWATGNALTCHYDGQAWTEVPSPQPRPAYYEIGYSLQSIGVVAADNIWIVGGRTLDYGQYITVAPLAEHWNGSQWTAYYDFPLNGRGVAVLPSGELWAVGDGGIAYSNGGGWQTVPSPRPGQAQRLNAVTAAADGTLWAAGSYSDENWVERTLIENAPSATQGTVRGDTTVSGAVVTWIGPVNGSTESNVFGEYGAAGLPAGEYTFIASFGGCSPDVATVMVTAGTTVVQDFDLGC